MNHGSLFNGIGGFQLAAEWMGWTNLFSCEIDEWCNKVTKKHFPDCIQHSDIKQTDFTIYRGKCDILTGGFPCQPFSVAGNQAGTNDDRHLWPQMLRAVREISPRYVVAENVPGLLSISKGLVFEQVCADLENIGYEVQPVIIPACAADAPHRRDRVWIVAKSNSNTETSSNAQTTKHKSPRETRSGRNGLTDTYFNASNSDWARPQGHGQHGECSGERIIGTETWQESWYEVATKFCRVDDGIPDRVHRLKGLGNAIVPQVAYEILNSISQTEKIIRG